MYVLVDPVFPETTATRHYPEIIPFPDAQKHVKYDGPFGTVFASIKNGDDLFMAAQLGSILQSRFGRYPKINCPWLFGLRCDRQFSEFEAIDARVVTEILNKRFTEVYVQCPHSSGSFSSNRFDETVLFSRAAFACEADTIVIPDAGAGKRFDIDSIMRLCRYDSGQDLNLVVCSKNRDAATGKLSDFTIESGTVGRRCLIIDDICDGGATFVGIQKLLREKGAKEVYLSVYHGIFSKGRVEGIDGVYTTNSYVTDEMAEKLGPWCRIKRVW